MTADRSLIARLAAHESWANTADPSARTAPARRAMLDRFERQVDPDGVLSPAERARRAGHARKAYFVRLALRSAQARRKAPAVEDGTSRSSRLDADEPALDRLALTVFREQFLRKHRLFLVQRDPNSLPPGWAAIPAPQRGAPFCGRSSSRSGTDSVSGGRGAPSVGCRARIPRRENSPDNPPTFARARPAVLPL
jgi:hypothetical protein